MDSAVPTTRMSPSCSLEAVQQLGTCCATYYNPNPQPQSRPQLQLRPHAPDAQCGPSCSSTLPPATILRAHAHTRPRGVIALRPARLHTH